MSKLNSPFFFQLKYYQPGEKNTNKNIAHLQYIGTRPGVNLGEPKLEEELSVEDHLQYMTERPRSHGLFSGDETASLDVAKEEMAEHNGFAWRAIVSLREDDAINLGYTEREAWEKMLKASMNEVAGKMGIRETNLKWYAAFHEEKGHPHCHIIFWEKVPERKRWTKAQSAKELMAMRKVFIQHIWADERRRLGDERTILREILRDKTKDFIDEAVLTELEIKSLIGETPGIPPKIRDKTDLSIDQLDYLQNRLAELAEMMPKKGRIALSFMPEETKRETLNIVNWLMEQPEMRETVQRIEEIAREYSAPYSFQKHYHDKAAEKAKDDIQKRLSQIVLRGAGKLNRVPFEQRQDFKPNITKGIWKSTWRVLERERSKAEAQRELAQRKEAWKEKMKHEQEEKGENKR